VSLNNPFKNYWHFALREKTINDNGQGRLLVYQAGSWKK
jgi:hypothetical protein